SVMAEHNSVATKMRVRSAPISGTLRLTQPMTRVNPGYTIQRITPRNTTSAIAVNASDPAENDPAVAIPAITDSTSQPTVSSTTPAERITTPRLRFIRLRSMRIFAITGIAEIAIAVAMNAAKIARWLVCAR